MATIITNIEQFIAENFNENSSDYIKLEAQILNSFLKRLVDLGFTLDMANDGEENHIIEDNNRFDMLDVIFSVDDSSIVLTSNCNQQFILQIALGNGDATPIYDHSTISEELETTIFSEFAKSVKSHSQSLYELNWA